MYQFALLVGGLLQQRQAYAEQQRPAERLLAPRPAARRAERAERRMRRAARQARRLRAQI